MDLSARIAMGQATLQAFNQMVPAIPVKEQEQLNC